MDIFHGCNIIEKAAEKGFLSATKEGNKLLYYPLISREQYDKREARGFVESKFRGSLKQFLVAFTGNKTLSKEEVKELKEWLDEFER